MRELLNDLYITRICINLRSDNPQGKAFKGQGFRRVGCHHHGFLYKFMNDGPQMMFRSDFRRRDVYAVRGKYPAFNRESE
ncbi:MAG: hypothetical protein Tsb009_28830 [Planctomycetaceae bacterium]